MPVKPNRSPTKSIRPRQTTETTSPILAQHGSPLVQLPSELLTHLTAYLDPVALNTLASVCRLLNAHVGQDNTWRCAFLCHFLGVPPDPGASIDHPKLLLLRRVERSWRAEFQKHWVMTKRWERSKAPTVTHRPHRAPISTMHVMQAGKNVQGTPLQPANCALLSASLTTGSVMRSYPFNGKIVRGHFDASSTTTALGLGLNPNLQEAFSNVSALALASIGGTGLVIWGLRSGGVAVTVAPRAMEAGCSARMIKCTLSDAHRSLVENVCVDEGSNGSECFATSSTDGSVKMWTLPTSQRGQVSCVWTGGYTDDGHVDSGVAALISVPCTKIAISVSAGVVAAGYADGTVLVWFGVSLGSGTVVDPHNVTCVRIPPLSMLPSALATLRLHAHSSTNVSVLVHHSTEGHFRKLKVDKDAGLVKRTRFGGGPLGAIEVVVGEFAKQAKEDARTAPHSTGPSGAGTPTPSFPSTPNIDTLPPALMPLHLTLPRPELGSAPRARSFVVAGDSLGRMCIWDWDAEEEEARKNPDGGVGDGTEAAVLEVPAAVVWDAIDGEGISAVAWSDVVVAIGTTRGHTLIFDSLTQQLLRRIQSPSPVSAHRDREAVSQFAIDGDVLLVAVDGQVLAWQARKEAGKGPNGPGKSGKGKKSTGGKSGGTAAKWQQRNELNTEISHSLNQLKHESAQSQPALRRARAQAGTLSEMGMDESDAVQYLMMLSRDEDDARRAAEAAVASAGGHEGEMGSGSSGIEGHDWPNRPGNKLKGPYGSPANSTHSSAPSASTSPSSRRSGPSVYIPANGRPRTSVEDDIPDVNPYLSRSPYGSYHSGLSYRSNESGGRGGAIIDEDEELRMVLEMSLLEQ